MGSKDGDRGRLVWAVTTGTAMEAALVVGDGNDGISLIGAVPAATG